jgi:hypothetical protein
MNYQFIDDEILLSDKYIIIFQNPVALIFDSLASVYKCKHDFYFIYYVTTFKIHKIPFKLSFVATCFGLTMPSSGKYNLEEITTLQILTRQY